MTIPSERILTEIEKHLERARPENPANMRETLAAIRALCDVVLEDGLEEPEPGIPALPRTPKASPLRMQETPIKEDGANGDSLFDF